MKNKLKTAFTLLVYIAVTVGIYALICHLNHQPFDDLRILYAVLIGCVAYLPRHLMVRKSRKSQKYLFNRLMKHRMNNVRCNLGKGFQNKLTVGHQRMRHYKPFIL